MSSTTDPSRDAAALLRRLGFAAMMLGLPTASLSGPSGAVIAAALGLVLLATASALDGSRPALDLAARSPALTCASGAAALILFWALLSLVWTPLPRAAAERLTPTLAIAALGLAGLAALPARMRSANLYFVPIGTALAAALALGDAIGSDGSDVEARRLERGTAVIALMAWPSVAWLRSRGRDIEAIALAALSAAATATAPSLAPITALAVGALAYGLVQLGGRAGALAVGAVATAAILLAPALLALAPLGPELDGWRAALLAEPQRLLTGHGYGSLARRGGEALARSPGAPLLGLWYELGLLGALAMAIASIALLAADATRPALRPGIAAAFSTAAVLTLSPATAGQPWWVASLAVATLAFVAAERAQFRTRRPRVVLFGRTSSA